LRNLPHDHIVVHATGSDKILVARTDNIDDAAIVGIANFLQTFQIGGV
jgi:hypothetical protein